MLRELIEADAEHRVFPQHREALDHDLDALLGRARSLGRVTPSEQQHG